RALHLTQPCNVFGHALFAENSSRHPHVTTRTSKPRLHSGVTATQIVVYELLYERVDCEVEVNGASGLTKRGQIFRANILLVGRQDEFRQIIQRRWLKFLLTKASLARLLCLLRSSYAPSAGCAGRALLLRARSIVLRDQRRCVHSSLRHSGLRRRNF